jgi:hypothetical protein
MRFLKRSTEQNIKDQVRVQLLYHCRGPGQEMLGNKVSMITVGAIVAEESHQGT